MITFFWFILFLIVFIIIFYGLLKDLNTLILKKYSIYFCDLSLKEVYESGEEYELELLKELSWDLKSKSNNKFFDDLYDDEKNYKEAMDVLKSIKELTEIENYILKIKENQTFFNSNLENLLDIIEHKYSILQKYNEFIIKIPKINEIELEIK